MKENALIEKIKERFIIVSGPEVADNSPIRQQEGFRWMRVGAQEIKGDTMQRHTIAYYVATKDQTLGGRQIQEGDAFWHQRPPKPEIPSPAPQTERLADKVDKARKAKVDSGEWWAAAVEGANEQAGFATVRSFEEDANGKLVEKRYLATDDAGSITLKPIAG